MESVYIFKQKKKMIPFYSYYKAWMYPEPLVQATVANVDLSTSGPNGGPNGGPSGGRCTETKGGCPSVEQLISAKNRLRPSASQPPPVHIIPESIVRLSKLKHVCLHNCYLHPPLCAGCNQRANCQWSCESCDQLLCAKCKVAHKCEQEEY